MPRQPYRLTLTALKNTPIKVKFQLYIYMSHQTVGIPEYFQLKSEQENITNFLRIKVN